MINATCQKEAFILAGRLSVLGTGYAWNLSKLDMRSRVAGGAILTIPKALSDTGHYPVLDNAVMHGFLLAATFAHRVCNAAIGFLESIKKGGISATLESVGQSAILHFGHVNLFRDTCLYRDQSFGVSCFALRRCRSLISLFAAVTRKPAILSPSLFSFSISSRSSRGSRTETCRERLFFLPVAITVTPFIWWCSVYTGKMISKHLKWCSLGYTLVVFTLSTSKAQEAHKITKPGSASTLTGPLTTNDSQCIEVAMNDITTPLTGRNSLTQNKFTWRFLAVSRLDRNAKPCRMSVEAHTEREARRVLAPHFILSLAARLPVQGIGEISIPSTIEQTSTVQGVSHV